VAATTRPNRRTSVLPRLPQLGADGPNVGSYCNKQLDALVAQAAGVVDPEQRAAIWKQAAKIENADPSMMWLYSLNNLFGVNKRSRASSR